MKREQTDAQRAVYDVIFAVPTGIITAELASEINRERSLTNCSHCERIGHENDAKYCKYCGSEL